MIPCSAKQFAIWVPHFIIDIVPSIDTATATNTATNTATTTTSTAAATTTTTTTTTTATTATTTTTATVNAAVSISSTKALCRTEWAMRRDNSPVRTWSGLIPAGPCTSSFLPAMKKWHLQVRSSGTGVRFLTTQGLSMKTSRSLMPSLTYMSFFYQWSLNVFTPLWPLNLFLSFSITHSTLGTSFLNRTEAASVEKIVTMYLKNGITPDQIGVRHSYPFNSYYPSLFFSVIHFISVCPYLRLSLIDVTWFFFARRTFLTPFFLACVSTIR